MQKKSWLGFLIVAVILMVFGNIMAPFVPSQSKLMVFLVFLVIGISVSVATRITGVSVGIHGLYNPKPTREKKDSRDFGKIYY